MRVFIKIIDPSPLDQNTQKKFAKLYEIMGKEAVVAMPISLEAYNQAYKKNVKLLDTRNKWMKA